MSERFDIGQQLKAAREKMELELADVQHRQRIPVRVLGALERSDYSIFSSPAYARSYLKQYSDFLGVDAGDWLDSFDVSGTLANLDNYDYLKVHVEDLPSRVPRRVKEKKRSSEADSAGALVPVLLTLITAALIGGGFWGYQYLDGSQEEDGAAAVELGGEEDGAEVVVSSGRTEGSREEIEGDDLEEDVEGPVPIRIDPPQEVPRAVIVPE